MKTHSEKFIQHRKFMMVIPALVLPFLVMIFWALGGGQGTSAQAESFNFSGLNLDLPDAHFAKSDELWNKFALYEQAKRDSTQRERAEQSDPYFVMTTLQTKPEQDTAKHIKSSSLNTSLNSRTKYSELDQKESMITEKLELLNKQLATPNRVVPITSPSEAERMPLIPVENTEMDADIERLEKMMQMIGEGDVNDPEMVQIDQMLDKILDIQHPERVQERIKSAKAKSKQSVFDVTSAVNHSSSSNESNNISPGIDTSNSHESSFSVQPVKNGFFGLEDNENQKEATIANAIEAVVHDTQTLVAGATVKMRLLQDVYINDKLVESGTLVYGMCAINNERLTISIESIRNGSSLLPVSLAVYDLDGMEGLYIPGAITRDAAKQTSGQAISDMQLFSMDQSLGTQAAVAGVEATKGLFSKKAKLLKVTIKANYKILLQADNISG